MNYAFYRPGETSIGEYGRIIRQMRRELDVISAGEVDETAFLINAKRLLGDARAVAAGNEMLFWGLDEPENMLSDARVDFIFTPTYIAVSILSLALLRFPGKVKTLEGFPEVLRRGLKASLCRGFEGHGYESFSGLLNCMEIFIKGRVFTLIEEYPDLCPEFTKALRDVVKDLREQLNRGRIAGMWGEDNTKQAEKIAEKIALTCEYSKVFVYGTLMHGQSNHNKFLGRSRFLANATLQGYALYDMGWYPGIKEKAGAAVAGEIYEVSTPVLERIHELEGEGSLYQFKKEMITADSGDAVEAGVYIYMHPVNETRRVDEKNQPWRGIL